MFEELEKPGTIPEMTADIRKNWARCYWSEDSLRRDGGIPHPNAISTKELADHLDKAYAGTMSNIEGCLDEVMDMIEMWRTNGDMPHWQYSQIWDVVNNALSVVVAKVKKQKEGEK